MYLECSGLPSAGKSTICKAIVSEARKQNLEVVSLNHLATSDVVGKKIPLYLSRSPQKLFSYRLSAFRATNRELMHVIDRICERNIIALSLFNEMTAGFYVSQQDVMNSKLAVCEEGFLHRASDIFRRHLSRSVGSEKVLEDAAAYLDDFGELVKLFPKIDVLAFSRIDPLDCLDRVGGRRVARLGPNKKKPSMVKVKKRMIMHYGSESDLVLQDLLIARGIEVMQENGTLIVEFAGEDLSPKALAPQSEHIIAHVGANLKVATE